MERKYIRIAIALLAAVMMVSCYMIVREVTQRSREASEFDRLAALANETAAAAVEATADAAAASPLETDTDQAIVSEAAASRMVTSGATGGQATESDAQEAGDSAAVAEETKSQQESKRNLEPIFEQNADCIGWLCIADTVIDYPVMHTPEEPQKYIHRNFDGEESSSGTPFLQETSTLDSDNLVIYGHNMKNGTMFGGLKKYLKPEYAAAHPVIELEVADGVQEYDIFAVALVRSRDIWYYFRKAENEQQYRELVDGILGRAEYDMGIVPEYGQQLITLSTCYGSNDDDRLIVIGAERK